ncbi:MAG TPA: cellulase family glycosylhydrolase [Saprospiraceae bacterium]|nr:cellulase family glycosylhydrolase [Saprospiraceae bacterium]HNT20868.1 cellulase family glycosylhydrolase [Saprospiraceae bacterium]
MNSKILLIAQLFLISTGLPAQTFGIHELNQKLGKGINMGNMFEAPAEGEWGNPFRDDYFQKIAGLGFNHVRIPIRWDVAARALQTAPFTIQPSFLERIKYVVDLALSQGLYVIINMHHHEALFQDPEGVKPRFLSQWGQISDYFKNYDQRLLFEVLNEPNTNLTGQKWNQFFKDALGEIRKTNPDRAVLMGIAPWGGLGGVPDLVVPEDENIIITVHYYDPFTFTHQGAEWVDNSTPWLGTKWENTTLERNEITGSFAYLINFAKSINKPIHVGEFGAYSKADLNSRVLWTNFLARWFESQGFSWAYWEWSAGFGIFDPFTNQYLTRLADALLKDPMLPAKPQTTVKVFESGFGPGDGWNLYVQGGAAASLSRTGGQGIVDVTQTSGTGWHVQLVQNNIQLKKDSRYLVTVKASSNTPVSITNYLGMNFSPWGSYSGYKSLSLNTAETEQTYSFIMTSPTDPAARLVFDLGNKPSRITISQVKVEEVLDVPVSYKQTISHPIKVFPNPSAARIRIEGIDQPGRLQILSADGKLCINFGPWNPMNTVDVAELIPGIYFLRIVNSRGIFNTPFIKY